MFLGTIVNSAAILLGSLSGALFRNISEKTRETVTTGISLGVLALGIQMALQTNSFIVIMISICIGGMIGEFLKIEDRMNQAGLYLEKKFANGNGHFAEGFVTASLIYLIGSMGIIGAIESGVSGDHQTLFTKAVMDGFTSIMLTASLGIGVMFSAFPVLLYQGALTVFASILVRYLPQDLMNLLMNEISAIGGVMVLGIGLNILKITQIRVSNYLPGIFVLVTILICQYFYF